MILEAIADTINEWPHVDASIDRGVSFHIPNITNIPVSMSTSNPMPVAKGPLVHHDTTIVNKIIVYRTFNLAKDAKIAKIWAGDIIFDDEIIYLSTSKTIISSKPWVYKNTILDPASLDELFTILATRLVDIERSLPEDLVTDRPNASSLPTKFKVIKLGKL